MTHHTYQVYREEPYEHQIYVWEYAGDQLLGICGPIDREEATANNLGGFDCLYENVDWDAADNDTTEWHTLDAPYPGDGAPETERT